MYDHKIFADVEGVFEWMKAAKEEEFKGKSKKKKIIEDEDNEPVSKQTIKEFLSFIHVIASEEEVDALHEILCPGEVKGIKAEGKDTKYEGKLEGKSKEPKGDKSKGKKTEPKQKSINHQDIYNLFVKQDKDLNKERDSVIECFKYLNGKDSDAEFIDVENFKTMMKTYEKKYVDSIDMLVKELESSHYIQGGKINIKKFVDDLYRLNHYKPQ